MNSESEILIAKQQYSVYLQAKRELALADFWEFCVEVLGYKNLQPFHQELCSFVQRSNHRKKLILLPRGHLKSTIVTVGYTLWRIAKNPNIRVLIANATAPMAEAFLRQIKSHLQKNNKFIELFGNLYDTAEKWSDSAIRLAQPESWKAKENTVTAYGIGGNLVSQHYDLMIFDDLVNRDNIHTPDRMVEVSNFYKDAQDLADDVSLTEQLMIGTRWHEGDLYGDILDPESSEKDQWDFLIREAVEGDYQIVSNGRGYKIEGGNILYESKFPRSELEHLIESKGLSDFSSQYLNNPVPAGTATFKHDFKYYEAADIRGWEFNCFITIDPAFYDPHKKSTDSDYTGVVVNLVNYVNDWFIADLINQRYSPNELIDLLFKLDSTYHPKTIGIEATAWQRVLGYQAREKMKTNNHFLPITELSHSGVNAKSKSDRILSLEPRYAVGSIYHNPNCRYISVLEDQLRRFPRTKYDDLIDALASQGEIAFPPKRKVVRGESEDDESPAMVNYPA